MPSSTGSHSQRQKFWLLWGTTSFFTLLVLGLHFFSKDFRRAEALAGDGLLRAGRYADASPEVVLLGIDSPSTTLDELMGDERKLAEKPPLSWMGQGWPWPRQLYPAIIERLLQAGAKVVAFDLLFPTSREGDEEFRRTIEKHPGRVLIGSTFQETQDDSSEKSPLVGPATSIVQGGAYDPHVGFVNFRSDDDRKVRRALYRTTALDYSGIPGEPGATELFSLSARIAQMAGYGDLIPPGRTPFVIRPSELTLPHSLYEIFVPSFWENTYRGGAFFKDKIVLIGPYGNTFKDTLETPFGTQPGPQVHLWALNTLLTGDFLHETSLALQITLILGAGFVAAVLARVVENALARVFAIMAIAAGYLAIALLLYNTRGDLLLIFSPLVTLVSSGGTYLGLERLLEYRERMRVRRTLEQYVSKDVVKEVLDNPRSYLNTLGGARKKITVLFSDVRDFTAMTERADEEKLVTQLREYFTEMVHIVFAHVGTLDKFIGDAVMASWGAIDASSRGAGPDAARAVSAALDMLRALPALNARWKAAGMFEFRVGIGVNHGEAICANIGSEEKQEFTAIGDAVNLASRLEGATKEYRQQLLIGADTAALVREVFTLRTVDFLRVKGKTKPVEVFTVLDLRDAGHRVPEWLAPYEAGIRLYRERLFGEAQKSFAEAATAQPDDYLIQEYTRRCREYLETPPGDGWDGVHVMTKK